jgi:nitrate reductase gamma subunit
MWSSCAFVVGGVLPYLVVLTFVSGVVYRFRAWSRVPQSRSMTLFPAAQGSAARNIFAEVFLFPTLFKSDRPFWFVSWGFHASLGLVAVGHLRLVTASVDQMLLSLGLSREGLTAGSDALGPTAGIVMLGTGVLLLLRRITTARVREASDASDFVALLLLLSIVVTGDLMRFGSGIDLAQARAWVGSLLIFAPAVPTDPAFLLHALLGQLLIIYVPFSRILHFGGIFFTQALVQRA